ncbi:MAG: transposase [Bacteroidetes bacterium]|nr:transposase [Bacteroidota bacterium]
MTAIRAGSIFEVAPEIRTHRKLNRILNTKMFMNRNRKQYNPAFKRRAVEPADNPDRTDRSIEDEPGLYQGAIRHWRQALEADSDHAFPGKGRLKPDDEELRRLRRELEIVRQERDILKKAMAILTQVGFEWTVSPTTPQETPGDGNVPLPAFSFFIKGMSHENSPSCIRIAHLILLHSCFSDHSSGNMWWREHNDHE